MVSAQESALDLLKCSSCRSAALFSSHSPSDTFIWNMGTRRSDASPWRPWSISSMGLESPAWRYIR